MHFVGIVLLALLGFASGLFYGTVGRRLVGNQDPQFTIVMLLGLAFSLGLTGYVVDAPMDRTIEVYVVSALAYVALRSFTSKLTALRWYYVPHMISVGALMLLAWCE